MMDGESSPEREHHPDVNGVTDKTCGADDDRDVENEEGLTADSALMTVSSTSMSPLIHPYAPLAKLLSFSLPISSQSHLQFSFTSFLQSSSTHLLISLSTYFSRQTLFGNFLSSHSSERFLLRTV